MIPVNTTYTYAPNTNTTGRNCTDCMTIPAPTDIIHLYRTNLTNATFLAFCDSCHTDPDGDDLTNDTTDETMIMTNLNDSTFARNLTDLLSISPDADGDPSDSYHLTYTDAVDLLLPA